MRALLAQTFRDFEILVIEDPPYDRAKEIVGAFKDWRIKYYQNPIRLGRYKSRNICIQKSRGKYLFFTDDDCVVAKDWIEQGLKPLNEDYIGVEGKTIYVSKKYKPTFSDHMVQNLDKISFMTCNLAYKKSLFKRIGKFDERYKTLGDRDFGLRAMKIGNILFNPKMIVHHQKVKLTPKEFILEGRSIRYRLLLYKKFGERPSFIWRIVYPTHLVAIMFPLLIFGSLLRNNYKSKEDFALFPFSYIKLLYERLNLWDACARERVFLI
jgi:GT2 family glycosyltransferase